MILQIVSQAFTEDVHLRSQNESRREQLDTTSAHAALSNSGALVKLPRHLADTIAVVAARIGHQGHSIIIRLALHMHHCSLGPMGKQQSKHQLQQQQQQQKQQQKQQQQKQQQQQQQQQQVNKPQYKI